MIGENGLKQRSMSSQYDPYGLGDTRTTKAVTVRNNIVRWSKPINIVLVRIVLCNEEYEAGIASNRKKECCGEY